MKMKKTAAFASVTVVLAACAAPLHMKTASFPAPENVPNHQAFDGLVVAAVPVTTKEASIHMFGTDMADSGLLPVQIIAENNGKHEFEIDASQAFAVELGGKLTRPYSLAQAAATVRASSIGTTAATNAFLGAAAGVAVGVAIGAAVGNAAGDTGGGAASGAAIGGAVGGTAGAASGMSDAITVHYENDLGAVSWGDRVLDPGDLKEGMIFLHRGAYRALRLKLFDVTANRYVAAQFALAP